MICSQAVIILLGILLFNLPALAGLVLAVAAVVRRQPNGLAWAAMLSLPLSWYLYRTPVFKLFGLAYPACLLAAGFALQRGLTRTAWALLAAPLALFLILLVRGMSQAAP